MVVIFCLPWLYVEIGPRNMWRPSMQNVLQMASSMALVVWLTQTEEVPSNICGLPSTAKVISQTDRYPKPGRNSLLLFE